MGEFWKEMRKAVATGLYPEGYTLLDKVVAQLKLFQPSETELYYENKYPKTDIVYAGREVPNSQTRVGIDVRNFFNTNDSMVKSLVKGLNLDSKTDDEKAVICLNWIVKNITYQSDTTRTGFTEYWQFPYETLFWKKGDCEDMSILLANMLIATGIPSWKIRINAGQVDDGKGNLGGHCFLVYYSESEDRWVLLDCCYYPNILAIKDRKDYKDETYYKETWFSFSEKYCWAKDVRSIPKLLSVEPK